MKLKEGTHGSFYNAICTPYNSIQKCDESSPYAKAINEYSLAFFNKHIKNDINSDVELGKSLPIIKEYKKEP